MNEPVHFIELNEPVIIIALLAGFIVLVATVAWFALDLRKAKKMLAKAEIDKDGLLSIIADANATLAGLKDVSDTMLAQMDSSGNLLSEIVEKKAEAGLYAERLDGAINKIKIDFTAGLRHGVTHHPVMRSRAASMYIAGCSRLLEPQPVPDEPPLQDESPISDDPPPLVSPPTLPILDAPLVLGTPPIPDAPLVPDVLPIQDAPPVPDVLPIQDAPLVSPPAAAETLNSSIPASDVPIVAFTKADRHSSRRASPVFRNSKYRQVMRCAQEGMDEAEIAKYLNIGRGEVALILELQKTVTVSF